MCIRDSNYFVPEDPRRSNFQVKYKPVEAREAVAELVRQSGAEIVGLCEMGGEIPLQHQHAHAAGRRGIAPQGQTAPARYAGGRMGQYYPAENGGTARCVGQGPLSLIHISSSITHSTPQSLRTRASAP